MTHKERLNEIGQKLKNTKENQHIDDIYAVDYLYTRVRVLTEALEWIEKRSNEYTKCNPSVNEKACKALAEGEE